MNSKRHFLLKTNKSSGYDRINFNFIFFGPLNKPLKYIVNLALATGIFPDDLKIASETPIFKAND